MATCRNSHALRSDGATQQAMLVRRYPVPDPDIPYAAGRQPCTYLVAYEGAAEDLTAWLTHYIADHPPIMARFPGIRQIEIYTCIDWCGGLPWPRVAHMQRNKVVFDNQAALTAALNSPVRHEMREAFHRFPPFTGPITHFPDGNHHRDAKRRITNMPVDPQIQALLDMGTGVPATNTLSVPDGARAV